MKWKINKQNTKDVHDVQKKQSVSSTTSMSILRDENLTFHRFATDVSLESRRTSDDKNSSNMAHKINLSTEQPHLLPAVWTTSSQNRNNYTTNANDFQFLSPNDINKGNILQSNSTAKLVIDEESTQQSKCSICRRIIFCLCLNITYANIVRFPRELEHHGTIFLIPYIVILLLIGLPTILLEISLGQFLGQDAAHSWRASPILKGASFIGRIASWLCAIWTSLQAIIAVVYIGELIFKHVPFTNCVVRVRLDVQTGYKVVAKSGQECIKNTFLTPIWEHTLYFALLMMSLIFLWTIAVICTYSSKTLRHSVLVIGIFTIILLSLLSGWRISQFDEALMHISFHEFDVMHLVNSTIWFSALVQVIYSTTIGIGVWPVITGKFLHKGDAVRTSLVYLFFNILIGTLSASFFIANYSNEKINNTSIFYPDLMPHSSIYDRSLLDQDDALLSRLLPGLSYLVIVLVAILTIAIYIYTSSRIFKRHPNYILSIIGLLVSIAALLCPDYLVSQILDTRIVSVFIICALIFDILSITWIYGAKTIYTDLEFSIGRPILKIWVFLWCITPIILAGLLTWWALTCSPTDVAIAYIPRWSPILLCLSLIFIVACTEVYKQVDYNCCNMIQEAAQPSKDWGPTDPIVRHAWKQWTSVCEDTGQRDFTLRRRGTRDYTHSIKKGQYSRNNQNSHYQRKTSTPGSSSLNFTGSIFDDSAIEEDVSCFQTQVNDQQQATTIQRPHSSRKTSSTITTNNSRNNMFQEHPNQFYNIRPIQHYNEYSDSAHTSNAGIVSQLQDLNYSTDDYRKALAIDQSINKKEHPVNNLNYGSFKQSIPNANSTHIWKKVSANSEEYSTEL